MLLELGIMAGTALLGKKVNECLDNNPKLNKKLNLAIGANYVDLDHSMKRQILDFIHDEIIHAAFECKCECRLSFYQLGLYDLFDLGFKEEILDLFRNVSSNMFKEARFYSKGIVFDISDYVLNAVNNNCTFAKQQLVV